ncbi:kynureninase [Amaricoccus sp.]|uniref:kynureninase n=1 Tax=Amaricoccus sp. TaxID=1872485 RepID=UPI001B7895EA|nr:kynureninase [Amaricoccus sp.]MBP7003700.1 kynureninase [Amaricoccus sp.]
MSDDAFWASALAAAVAEDANDALAGARGRFRLPPGIIYLDGNSLGPAPEAALAEIEQAATREWARDLIGSWNSADWFALPTEYGDLLAPTIGAEPGEVVVCDTVSINIFKMLHAAFAMRPDRSVVVAEAGSFPTDLYVAEGAVATCPGARLRLEGVDGPDILDLIDADVAVVLVNQVDYRTGRLRDLAAVTAKAHAMGALAIWDLCHSAGVVEVGLNAGRADMAVGCTYKYLNGGPGSPAFVFAARRHHAEIRQPLSGWWGHARPFAFDRGYSPDPGIRKFLCGTQPILSFRAMRAGLAMFHDFPMAAIRAKSQALTDRFIALTGDTLGAYEVDLLSPREATARGSQVALTHAEAYAVTQALIHRGVVGDFRAPDVMRFGFAPLYLSHADVVRAARTLHQVLAGGCWDAPQYRARAAVT